MSEEEFIKTEEYLCAYCRKTKEIQCNDYFQCCDEMNKLKNKYTDYLENIITDLQQRINSAIKKLKQLDENFIQEEHIGSARDDDCEYEELLSILQDKEVINNEKS